ncbi:hypothetical protein SCD_n02709 [Sulfuricella denitrificans skB26]|uniref:Uncharacterized protein n=1 Tax=Sulfuricella denitrificans (strain DSM 22764 / NBRC 105220 / skB26) TaxID=1163617 RepID=S6ANP9_SULDS|nr:hypothetical protein [Sulfuricella denitrificans]BAN36509.1 hypothetical protein SCD_n02709 [Sulfuricella denitrificans skB26]
MINPAKRRSVLGWLAAALSALLLAGVMPATADDEHGEHSSHKLIAKGDKCVRDEDYMRRNHMKILMHQRDETMRKGIRGSQDSLKNCIECHVNPKTNSVASSKEDFCMGCHTYAAVKLDCFECHSSKPKAPAVGMNPIVTPEKKPEGNDKQSSMSGKMRWQLQAKQASLNMGEGVK